MYKHQYFYALDIIYGVLPQPFLIMINPKIPINTEKKVKKQKKNNCKNYTFLL